MRVQTQRIGLALVFAAFTAAALALLADQVSTKSAGRRLIAPAPVNVEAVYPKIIPSEVERTQPIGTLWSAIIRTK